MLEFVINLHCICQKCDNVCFFELFFLVTLAIKYGWLDRSRCTTPVVQPKVQPNGDGKKGTLIT